MARTKTTIANMAIRFCGIGHEIEDLDTTRSAEADSCRAFYDEALLELLEEGDWSFATKFATLELITTSPTTEWAYAYKYPTDCVALRRILSGAKVDTNDSRVPRIIADHSGVGAIYTDMQDAVAEYTYAVTNVNLLSSSAATALAHLLASKVAADTTLGDRGGLSQQQAGLYRIALQKALKVDKQEAFPGPYPDAELIRVRR